LLYRIMKLTARQNWTQLKRTTRATTP